MTIYISGGMTGIPNKNFPAFDAARDRLLAQGYCVVSPADLERHRPPFPYKDQLRDDLKHLLECNAIYLLRGWEKSNGARIETFVAQTIGLQVLYE